MKFFGSCNQTFNKNLRKPWAKWKNASTCSTCVYATTWNKEVQIKFILKAFSLTVIEIELQFSLKSVIVSSPLQNVFRKDTLQPFLLKCIPVTRSLYKFYTKLLTQISDKLLIAAEGEATIIKNDSTPSMNWLNLFDCLFIVTIGCQYGRRPLKAVIFVTGHSIRFIDWMVFNAIFNSISVISPVYLSMLSWSSFNQYSAQYSFQAIGCFPI